MQELLDRDTFAGARVKDDEHLARTELRRQIGRLERDLIHLAGEAFPRLTIDTTVPAAAQGPRLIGLGELERIRDALASRVAMAREVLLERKELEAANGELLERMLAEPAEFKWVRISRTDLGEPGCGHWHSRPRFGLLGMLMGWWRVRISSGCPLPGRLAAVEQATAG